MKNDLIAKPIWTSLFRPLNDYTSLSASGQGSSVDDPETSKLPYTDDKKAGNEEQKGIEYRMPM